MFKNTVERKVDPYVVVKILISFRKTLFLGGFFYILSYLLGFAYPFCGVPKKFVIIGQWVNGGFEPCSEVSLKYCQVLGGAD